MASSRGHTEGDNNFGPEAEPIVNRSPIPATPAIMISELYVSVARLEGKLASVMAGAQATDREVGKISDMLDLVTENTRDAFKDMQEQLNQVIGQQQVLTQMALVNQENRQRGEAGSRMGPNRVKVPEPRLYKGTRDAAELENFLFDLGQYFEVVQPESEQMKIKLTAMYLDGDAKIWWRVKHKAIEDGTALIETFEEMKQEMKKQFMPENVGYLAWQKLRRLRHVRSIREYVKDFSVLLLDVADMNERDKMYAFMDGLKSWVQQELQRKGVDDLPSTMQAAELLRLVFLGTWNVQANLTWKDLDGKLMQRRKRADDRGRSKDDVTG